MIVGGREVPGNVCFSYREHAMQIFIYCTPIRARSGLRAEDIAWQQV